MSLRAAGYSGIRQPDGQRALSFVRRLSRHDQCQCRRSRTRSCAATKAGSISSPTSALTFSATAFYNKVDHAIANVTLALNSQQRQNVDAIRAKGLEFGAALHFGNGQPRRIAGADRRESAVDGERNTRRGLTACARRRRRKSRCQRHLLRLAATPWLNFAATPRHIGAQFEDDINARHPAGRNDARRPMPRVPIAGPFSLTLRGENLTDEDVVTRNQAGSIDLRAPRTLWAGVKVRVR